LIGNTIGWVAARIFKQSFVDTIAIAIETGVQNTGMAMFLITFSLDQPAADITMVIPIAVSILSPIPIILFAAIRKCWQL
jgi:sodium/bile acid cotransporter 3/5